MRGLKISGIFAACGFLLSLIFGLFSHTSFISVLLKALIFAISFGILGFIIDFLFEKFLLDDSVMTSSDGNQNISSGSENSSSKGQLVDITIEDEELVPSTSDNHFVVSENHQMLNDSDLANKNKPEAEQKETVQDNGFVPLKNLETLNNFAGKEAVKPESVVSSTDNSEDDSKSIDTLPDMNNLSLEDNNSGYEDAETDSEFVSSANMNKNNGEPTEIKDAALMAKAISSVLSDEES